MRGRSLRAIATPALACAALATVAGCAAATGGKPAGNPPSPSGAAPVATCGTSQTAAGVPVEIEIARGGTACAVAMSVERDYTRAIASGQVAGNGGGAPTKVRGWVCQGFNTPEVLSTGDTSACRRAGAEILAVLPSPTPPTPSS